MPRFILECHIELPADAFEQAEIISKIQGPWTKLVEELNASAVTFKHKSEIADTVAKPQTGTRRGRKPRVQHPGLLLAESHPPEAAE